MHLDTHITHHFIFTIRQDKTKSSDRNTITVKQTIDNSQIKYYILCVVCNTVTSQIEVYYFILIFSVIVSSIRNYSILHRLRLFLQTQNELCLKLLCATISFLIVPYSLRSLLYRGTASNTHTQTHTKSSNIIVSRFVLFGCSSKLFLFCHFHKSGQQRNSRSIGKGQSGEKKKEEKRRVSCAMCVPFLHRVVYSST